MDMNTVITLRRNTKPATPSTNRTALSVRYQETGTGTSVISVQLLLRQDNRAHDADQDQDGSRLERQQVGGEQRAANIERRAVLEAAENHRGASRIEPLDEIRQQPEQGDQQRRAQQLRRERPAVFDLRARVQQHDHE